jgi:hypothetical protein
MIRDRVVLEATTRAALWAMEGSAREAAVAGGDPDEDPHEVFTAPVDITTPRGTPIARGTTRFVPFDDPAAADDEDEEWSPRRHAEGMAALDDALGALAERRRQAYVGRVLSRPFALLARAWKATDFAAQNLAALPLDEKGAIEWRFAGPLMFRELPLVRFVLVYTLGLNPAEAEDLAKRIINEWHGLDPLAGMGDHGMKQDEPA